MTTPDIAQQRLLELESLTRSYARFSRSAGGLGSVLGGMLGLVSYFGAALLPLTLPVRVGLIAIPVAWLLCKGWLTHRYYQRFGHVEEQESRSERLVHRAGVALTALVAVMVTVGILNNTRPPGAGAIGYLVLLWLLPLAAWRWLRSPLDFIVGVFLICEAAMACIGHAYPLVGTVHTHEGMLLSLVALELPLASLMMIGAGMVEHRRFLRLQLRLRQRGSGVVEAR